MKYQTLSIRTTDKAWSISAHLVRKLITKPHKFTHPIQKGAKKRKLAAFSPQKNEHLNQKKQAWQIFISQKNAEKHGQAKQEQETNHSKIAERSIHGYRGGGGGRAPAIDELRGSSILPKESARNSQLLESRAFYLSPWEGPIDKYE